MIGKRIPCWHCGEKMTVIGFLAVNTDQSELDGEPCVLSDITGMPEELLSYVQLRVPNFRLQYSRTAGDRYSGSSCPSCGKLYGDHYLHHDPGVAFFPCSEEDARALYITELPLAESVEVYAGCHVGTADMILECAKRIS